MTKRRLDLETSEENILQTIERNALGRNNEIVDYIKMFSDTEGPYTYLLDGAWGSGKTFFVRQLVEILNILNNHDAQKCKFILENIKKIDSYSMQPQLIPYHFNAWENDFFDDPLLSIFSDMANYFGNEEAVKNITFDYMGLIKSILDNILELTKIPLRISQIDAALTIEDYTEPFKLRRKIREGVVRLLDAIANENPNYKLIIFIDELDRCKPEFAKRVLEETKNLFVHNNVILVYITDSSQLAKSLQGIYGSSYDCNKYLERFYDERVVLLPVTGFNYLSSIGILSNGSKVSTILRDLSKDFGYTIRDANRLQKLIESAIEYDPLIRYEDNRINQLIQSAKFLILPVMILIQKEDKGLFDKIVAGEAPDAIFEFARKSPRYISMIPREQGGTNIIKNESDSLDNNENACREYMHNLSIMVYGDEESREFMDVAASYFGVSSTQYFDSKVFKELRF